MERGLHKGYMSMCTYMAMCPGALHERALTNRLRGAEGANEKTYNKHGTFRGDPRIRAVNFAVSLRQGISHAKVSPHEIFLPPVWHSTLRKWRGRVEPPQLMQQISSLMTM